MTATVADAEPDVPRTSIAKDPDGLACPVARVRVEVPDVMIDDGLKVQDPPEGRPLRQDRLTVPSKFPLGATVILILAELPASTETDVGDADNEKSELPPPTTRVIVVVLVVEPDVPCTVITNVPDGVEVLVTTVSIDVPEPSITNGGLNEHEAAEGTPLLHVKVTPAVKSPVRRTLTVVVAEPPEFTESLLGLADKVNPVISLALRAPD